MDCILCYFLRCKKSELYQEDADWVELMFKTILIARAEMNRIGASSPDEEEGDLNGANQSVNSISKALLENTF